MAMATGASATQLMGVRIWLMRRNCSGSLTTMNSQGWVLRELPVQRAISSNSWRMASGTGFASYSLAWRTLRISRATCLGLETGGIVLLHRGAA